MKISNPSETPFQSSKIDRLLSFNRQQRRRMERNHKWRGTPIEFLIKNIFEEEGWKAYRITRTIDWLFQKHEKRFFCEIKSVNGIGLSDAQLEAIKVLKEKNEIVTVLMCKTPKGIEKLI